MYYPIENQDNQAMDKCIFIVEDNDAHAEIIKRCLKKCEVKYPIKRANNGEDARNYLVEKKSDDGEWLQPQLILLDIRLPRISGLELLKEVRSQEVLCNTPIIILTSSAAQPDVDAAYASHVSSYLVKPMDYTEYVSLFQMVTKYWLTLNVN